jgi:hypothetical protein
MSRTLTASDRSALIRLASSLPKGNPTRRGILAGLKRVAEEEDAKPKGGGKKKPGSMLKKFLAEVGDQKAQNPDTGNQVKVKTLAGKPKDSKAYKIFKDQFDKWMEEQDKEKGKSKDKKPESKKKPLIDDMDSKEWGYFVDDTESEIFSQLQDLETEMAMDADGELDEDVDPESEAMSRWEEGVKEDKDEDPVGFLTSALNVFEKTLAEAKKYDIDKDALRNAEKEFKALKESIEYNTMPSDLD